MEKFKNVSERISSPSKQAINIGKQQGNEILNFPPIFKELIEVEN